MPTPETQHRADQLEKAVIACGPFCDIQTRALTNKFLIECVYTILIPVVATVLAYFFINAAAIIAPLVIGAANIIEKISSSKTLFATYNQDKAALRTRVVALLVRIRLALQEPNPDIAKSDLDGVAQDIGAIIVP